MLFGLPDRFDTQAPGGETTIKNESVPFGGDTGKAWSTVGVKPEWEGAAASFGDNKVVPDGATSSLSMLQ